jgi:hypothetical protein
MKKCVKLVISKNYIKMRGQQNIHKFRIKHLSAKFLYLVVPCC